MNILPLAMFIFSLNSCTSTYQASESNPVLHSAMSCEMLPFDFEVGEQSLQPFKQALEGFEAIDKYDFKALHFRIAPGNKKGSLVSILLKSVEESSFVIYTEADAKREQPLDGADFSIYQQNIVAGSYLSDCIASNQSHVSSDLFVFTNNVNEWKIHYTGDVPEDTNNDDFNLPRRLITYILNLEQSSAQ